MRALWNLFQRYGLSMSGPVGVSGGHFLSSLIILRVLPPAAFGQFSFLLVVVPFALSLVAALLNAPAAQTRGMAENEGLRIVAILQKGSLAVSAVSFLGVSALMLGADVPIAAALCFGLYGCLFTLRGFARALHNVRADYVTVAQSDLAYAFALAGSIAALAWTGRLGVESGAIAFAAAAMCGLIPFGPSYLRMLIRSARGISLAAYGPIWREIGRWSLAGVVLTEATINAHAYLVTFMVGPHAFGLLAIGALFMRPAALVQSALPEIDMPLINRHIANNDMAGAFQRVREFRTVGFLALINAVSLAAAIMYWFPNFVLAKGYGHGEVLAVLAFWIAITGLRALRTPDAVFLQAANRYRQLARISLVAGLVSVASTLALLIAFGPVLSLGGLVLGEAATVLMLVPAMREFRSAHA